VIESLSESRVIVRKIVSIGGAGNYSYQLNAPEGHRVVSGFFAVAENETGNYPDIDFAGSYPYSTSDPLGVNVANAHGLYDAWRFQIKANASTAVWLGVICERSTQPDVYVSGSDSM
jgi:hypothetical protein